MIVRAMDSPESLDIIVSEPVAMEPTTALSSSTYTTSKTNLIVSEPVAMEPTTALSSSTYTTNVPKSLLCKNRLQEYAQRLGLPLPMYQTINEGFQHAPRFRSTVFVEGTYITSPNTFTNRKAAERDVASVALASLTKKIREEGYYAIHEATVFCKSILSEYAVKMNLEKPTYTTIQPSGGLPVFTSSLVFNGVNYTGEAARNKKEAEQLAARAVILSIFGNTASATVIAEIIKSKFKLFAALNKVKDSCITQNGNTALAVNTGTSFDPPSGNGKEVEVTGNENTALAFNIGPGSGFPFGCNKEVEISGGANNMTATTSEACSGQLNIIPAIHQPFHEFKKPKWEQSLAAFTPIVFVPQALEQSLGVGPSSVRKRNRKNKKKSVKKAQFDAQSPVDVVQVVPHTQVAPCSVAQ